MLDDVTVAILAGGRSRRMGTDKSFVSLAGKPLIQHTIEQASVLNLPLILIANAPGKYIAFDLPIYSDIQPGRGSLGGVYTAVHCSQSDYTLCVACDMPFLNVDLLRYMLDLRFGFDAVVPYTNGNYESLHAIYRRTCLPITRDQMEREQLRIRDIYPHLHVRMVTEVEIDRFDPQRRSFVNLNTPDDVTRTTDWLR